MTTSPEGIALIHEFESFSPESYLCPAGVWTIGWGTTQVDGRPVVEGMTTTRAQADEWFAADLAAFEACVLRDVRVELSQSEFDALVSFAYNVGCGAFRDSTLLKKLNTGDRAGAADEFARWNKGGGQVLAGLTRRREAERNMFEGVA
jgi:GH24 family phage-related lysozyme (muramidase)